MSDLKRADDRASAPPASLIAIGNMDGVHRGHRAVLERATREAGERGLEACLLTFDPHPASVLGAGAPPLLTTPERKRELLARHFPSLKLETVRFDADLAAKSPEAFVREILVGRLGARGVLVGENFRFGRARAGDLSTLEHLGGELGFTAAAVPLVSDEVGPISSSRVRDAVARGDVRTATELLGRPHMLSGEVTRGDQRGRTLGFPTANLTGVREALPASGVYAIAVDVACAPHDEEFVALSTGVANVGVRPTVDPSAAARPKVEAHLFEFDGDLYGARLRVHLIAALRPEQKFSDLEALRLQIQRDAASARARLAEAALSRADSAPWF